MATQTNVTTIINQMNSNTTTILDAIEGANVTVNFTSVLNAISNLNNVSINDIVALNLATQNNITTLINQGNANTSSILAAINGLNNLSLSQIINLNLSTQDNITTILTDISNLNNLSIQEIIDLQLATASQLNDNSTTIITAINNLENLSLADILTLNLATQDNITTLINQNNDNTTTILNAITGLNNLSIDQIIALNLATQDNITTIIADISNLNNLSLQEIIDLGLATQTNVTTLINSISGLNNLSIEDIIALNLATEDQVNANTTTILAAVSGLNNISITDIIDLNLATQINISTLINQGNSNTTTILAAILNGTCNLTAVLNAVGGLNNLSLAEIIALELSTQDNITTILYDIDNLNSTLQANVTTILNAISNANATILGTLTTEFNALKSSPIITSIELSGNVNTEALQADIWYYVTVTDSNWRKVNVTEVNLTIYSPLNGPIFEDIVMTNYDTGLYRTNVTLNASDPYGTYYVHIEAEYNSKVTHSARKFVVTSGGVVVDPGVTGGGSSGTVVVSERRSWQVTPLSIEFENENHDTAISIKNTGIYTLHFKVSPSNTLQDIVIISPTTVTVTPGNTEIIDLRFNPDAGEEYEGHILIEGDDEFIEDSKQFVAIGIYTTELTEQGRSEQLLTFAAAGDIPSVATEGFASLMDPIAFIPKLNVPIYKWIIPFMLAFSLLVINYRRCDHERAARWMMLLVIIIFFSITAFMIPSVGIVSAATP